ncbi:hypothetical protein SODALDRAFT_397456 [Sodiomyces alkalinus F11]|uniref:RRM domain-containing protein n=1 Tax=Sodiomyces alkalinus (strain CBS 110278 / VKM F-3762 / F11) TaxID=1314773 RepID=A0A3N2Q4K3_SODAK|nr:hypothetical protein SODALDRAFT_397456 [Sodiomyces alkalinus F11]ROT41704.1 hypothetical protein SODALDRAFT_397456 [Sodiomyces alkalinus F11]
MSGKNEAMGQIAQSLSSMSLTGEEDDVFSGGGGTGNLRLTKIPDGPALHRGGQAPQAASPSRKGRAMGFREAFGLDAQEIYSPGACVFVANLPNHVEDSVLETEVNAVFSRFGAVFVKIRRDGRTRMPFAFCQFTTFEDAQRALVKGKGIEIFGRPCRTEKVRANCDFYVYRRDNRDTSIKEAKELLEPFGRISKAEILHPQTANLLGLSASGVLVSFMVFDAKRDVVGALQDDEAYCVRTFSQSKVAPRTPQREKPAMVQDWSRQYEYHKRTIFVSNLPADISKETLHNMASEFGEVINITIKWSNLSGHRKAFAFIEFDNHESPNVAVAELDGTPVPGGDGKLIVERKSCKVLNPGAIMTPDTRHRRLIKSHEESDIESKEKEMVPQTGTPVAGSGMVSPEQSQSAAAQSYHPQAHPMMGYSPLTPQGYGYYSYSPAFSPAQLFSPFAVRTPYYDPSLYHATFSSPSYMMGGYPPSIPETGQTSRSEPANVEKEPEEKKED